MLDGDPKSSSQPALPLPSSKAARQLDSEKDSSRRDDTDFARTTNNLSLSRDESSSPNKAAISSNPILKRASSASAHQVKNARRVHNSSHNAPAPNSLAFKTQTDLEKISTMLGKSALRISGSQGTPSSSSSSSTGKTKPRPEESKTPPRLNGQGSKCTPRTPADTQKSRSSRRPGFRPLTPKTATPSTEDDEQVPEPNANRDGDRRGNFQAPDLRPPTIEHSSLPDAQLNVAIFQPVLGRQTGSWSLFLDRNGSGDILSDIHRNSSGHWCYREREGLRPEMLVGHRRNVQVGAIRSCTIPGYLFELSHTPINPGVPHWTPHIWVLDVLERLEAVHMIEDCEAALAELLDQNTMPAVLAWILRPNAITAGPR